MTPLSEHCETSNNTTEIIHAVLYACVPTAKYIAATRGVTRLCMAGPWVEVAIWLTFIRIKPQHGPRAKDTNKLELTSLMILSF